MNGAVLKLHQRMTSTIHLALYLKHKLIKYAFFLQNGYKRWEDNFAELQVEDEYSEGT